MQKVQFLRGHLYEDHRGCVFLYKRRGAGGKGPKRLVFERVTGKIGTVSQIAFYSTAPEMTEISREDLALHVNDEVKYPAFHKLMKED